MAIKMKLQKDNIIKEGFLGFSWTILFFGFWVPLFRKDYLISLGMLVIQLLFSYMETSGFFWIGIILSFFYNKIYTESLIKKGFRPIDKENAEMLKEAGIYF